MNIENSEKLLRLLFQKTLDKYKLTEINTKGVVQALRSVLSTIELHRLFFVLNNLPSSNMRTVEIEVLKGYQIELMTRLEDEHLFIARNKEFHIVRRPEILLTYTYMGKLCLAISERQLVTGDNGILVTAEIADFQYLPKPNRATSVGNILKAWKTDHKTIDQFLLENYANKAHMEQVDIFYDKQFNLLKYNRSGEFVGALPEPDMISTISIQKGKLPSSPIPQDNEEIIGQEVFDDEEDIS